MPASQRIWPPKRFQRSAQRLSQSVQLPVELARRDPSQTAERRIEKEPEGAHAYCTLPQRIGSIRIRARHKMSALLHCSADQYRFPSRPPDPRRSFAAADGCPCQVAGTGTLATWSVPGGFSNSTCVRSATLHREALCGRLIGIVRGAEQRTQVPPRGLRGASRGQAMTEDSALAKGYEAVIRATDRR